MAFLTNVTEHAAAHLVGRDREGRTHVTCVVKAEYTWQKDGTLVPVPAEPIRGQDQYGGPEANPALLRAAELGPPKLRTDVLLAGALAFPAPVEVVDVALEVGRRLRKTVRVFGDRFWLPGVATEMRHTRAKPFAQIPISWEKSFGGIDPEDRNHAELRNPVGVGMRRKPEALSGSPLPNFENPAELLQSPRSRPAPAGFGALPPHWLPRSKLAGTYDKRWSEGRRPLLPDDFDPAYFNVAPLDQQLDQFVPGEEVRLVNMTVASRDRFVLPDATVPVTFITDEAIIDTSTTVDTVIIEPDRRRLALISRALYTPLPSLMVLRGMIAGPPSRGLRRAIQSGKQYLVRDRPRAAPVSGR
jgi:hypothetical protein